jgi:hypothetical protein
MADTSGREHDFEAEESGVESNLRGLAEFVVDESQRTHEKEIRNSDKSSAHTRLWGVVSVGVILHYTFSLSLERGTSLLTGRYLSFTGYQWPTELMRSVWVLFTMLSTIGFGDEVPLPIANDWVNANASASNSTSNATTAGGAASNASFLDNDSSTLDDEVEVVALLFLLIYILVGLGILGNVIEVLRSGLNSDRADDKRDRRALALSSIARKLHHAAFSNTEMSTNIGPVKDVGELVRSMFSRIDISNTGHITLRQLCAYIDRLRSEMHLCVLCGKHGVVVTAASCCTCLMEVRMMLLTVVVVVIVRA